MIYFCGYPVPYNFLLHGAPRNLTADFEPCGKPATPGHAFCDEHGKLFEQENIRIVDRRGPAHTEQRRARQHFWMIVASLIFGALLALYWPIHTWLHAHVQFLSGILVGTLAQSIPWLIDRWRWLKWFSW